MRVRARFFYNKLVQARGTVNAHDIESTQEIVMDKELLVIVPNEKSAYEVIHALKSLDEKGSIKLYLANVVTRTKSGIERIRESWHLHPSLAAVVGATTGAVIGSLGGPPGAAIGAAIGGAVGIGGEVAYTGLTSAFVHDVAKRLPEGGYAVVASVVEDDVDPVDIAMAPFGGVALRQTTHDVIIERLGAHERKRVAE